MTKTEILFEVGKDCPDLAEEILALLKRLDKAGEFSGPAKEANERRFAKLCREALTLRSDYPDGLRAALEAAEDYLQAPGRPAMDPNEKRKNRSIKMTDTEWAEMQRRAEAEGVSVAEYIRRKTLAWE